MKLSPGLVVIRTAIWSDSTRVPPVTALRSPPDSRITGADSPVMADSSIEAMPSTTSPSPGMISPGVTTQMSPSCSSVDGTSTRPSGSAHVRHRLGPRPAQRGRLGLAPPFGDGLGEVGEQHREPQPGRHQAGEPVVGGRARAEVAHEQDGA